MARLRCYAPQAERALAAAQQAQRITGGDALGARALGDAHVNLEAARFVDHINRLDENEPLPPDLWAPCHCVGEGDGIHASEAWTKRTARLQRPYWEQLAARHGCSLDQYLVRVDARLRRVVAPCHLYVRVPYELLPAILAAGRLGTENAAGQGGGGALAVRQQTAQHVFAHCPQHTPSDVRHVFAYLATPDQWASIAWAPRRWRHFGLDRFGDIDLELDRAAVEHRTTVTFGALADVTDCGFRPGACPRLLVNVDHLAYPVHVADRGFGWQGWVTRYRTTDPLAPGAISPLRHVLQGQVRGPVGLADILRALPAFPVDGGDRFPLLDEFNAALQGQREAVA